MDLSLPDTNRAGLLLVGHGTRDRRGQAEFLATAAAVAQRCPAWIVQPCFLELATPSLDAGLEQLVASGARDITVAPVLLFAAGHAKLDIPQAIAEAQSRHPQVRFHQTSPLGCHERILMLSAQRCREAVRVGGPDSPDAGSPPEETVVLLVGRGTRDVEALADVARFAAALTRVVQLAVRVCFLAAAPPPFDVALAELAQGSYRTVIVQPHLLYAGELLETVRRGVEAIADRDPTRCWRLARHLGPELAVVDALLDRCRADVGKH
ncbi:MAG: sirohydrochlorin chelatase [Pirellulales bacterium]